MESQAAGAKGKSDIGFYAFLGFMVLFGLGFAGLGFYLWMKVAAMESWPSVTGKVASAMVESYRYGSMEERAGLDRKTKYGPRISYEYEFKGRALKGKGISVFSTGTREAEARKIVERYPVGAEVRVYVNPAHPEDAYLQREGSRDAMVYMVIGGVFAFFGLAGLVEDTIKRSRSA